MGKKQIAVRFEEELLARVDAYMEQMQVTALGLDITRADAIRNLVERGLADAERQRKEQRK
jgi:hypothetical protein